MQENILTRQEGETLEQCLYRLGCLKKTSEQEITWNHIADFLNNEFNLIYGESAYRKRYKRLCKAISASEVDPLYQTDYSYAARSQLRELEKQRIRIQQEKTAYRKQLREEADLDSVLDELRKAIATSEPPSPVEYVKDLRGDKTVFAMLSDIHFGLSFQSYYNKYSPQIAQERVMTYAEKLIEIGKHHNAESIHVALLGDLISGNIHQSIRSESKVNVIQQVVGVSELISAFLLKLSAHFKHVYVTDVAGNHSRIEQNAEAALRSERLDTLIPWYCKAKLEHVHNIQFASSFVDPTIAVLDIYGKIYIAVHGDFDHDLKQSALRIGQLIGRKVDYFLAGHMHVAEMRIEDVGYIRNGAVVSGGDEYTSKKRLFGPAMQICMLVSHGGVEAIYPIRL